MVTWVEVARTDEIMKTKTKTSKQNKQKLNLTEKKIFYFEILSDVKKLQKQYKEFPTLLTLELKLFELQIFYKFPLGEKKKDSSRL